MPDEAKHEGMADVVIFEAAGATLTDVAEIADAKGDAPEAEVQRQKLAEAESIARMSKQDVVTYALLRNLIIALAKLRAKHNAYHRHICLISCLHLEAADVE